MPLERILSYSLVDDLDDLVEEAVAVDVVPRRAGAVGQPDAKSGRLWIELCLSGTSSTDSDYEREEFRAENHHVDHLRVRVRDSRRRKFLGIVG